MNTSEGLMRIAAVVRWAGYLFAVGVVVFTITITYDEDWEMGGVVGILVAAAFCAGVGWTVSWIIEGFAKPTASKEKE